jgi:hypothetical protein
LFVDFTKLTPASKAEKQVAEGSPLPYLGYVEVSISVTFQSDNMMVLLLVVPETDYYKSVPVVIGTNILRPIK